ncbi:hypothetical protein FACS18942_06600 [Planctomycetales bacterium]|nr:hypothetical protein FACS18942_06600 [Planctomycetales bacterium]
MGIFQYIFGKTHKESEQTKRRKNLRNHICKFEEIEKREMLSATPFQVPSPIDVGIVYHEDYNEGLAANQGDSGGDTFIISWQGGANGTVLSNVVIDLTKNPIYGTSANIHFNINGKIPNSDGTYYNFDDDLPQNDGNGIRVLSAKVSDNGKVLTINFDGFTADKTFYFKIDVDEIGGEIIPSVDRLVTGKEMEGAMFSGVFSAAHYADKTFSLKITDEYSSTKAAQVGLPPDKWYENNDDHDNTAGAVEQLGRQIPLSGSLSGYVYEDVNNDGIKNTGDGTLERGIAGVWLELFVMNEQGQYVKYGDAGMKTQTDNNGYYCFDNIEGGKTYLVAETQPDGYLDGKDTPGTIKGIQVGTHWEPDTLAGIHIGPEEHGINYNFGELKRASVSGYVYDDRNNNGLREAGEAGIAGVAVKLQRLNSLGQYEDVVKNGSVLILQTGADGSYIFDGLNPFETYRIVETQPTGWIDGKDTAGYIGGTKVGTTLQDDKISGVVLGYNQDGIEYNFGEYKNGSISGHVYEDNDDNKVKTPGEPGIPGVTIWLCVLDENGVKHNVAQTVTDENGYYEFKDIEPGHTYCVTEFDPEGYCNGATNVGSIGGVIKGEINENAAPGTDQIHNIVLGSDDNGINYNFGENLRGVLSGYVYLDKNVNGVKDAGESGIGGTVLSLWVWNGSEYVQTGKTATTAENGYYEFTGLCPFKKYQISEAQPQQYLDGGDSIGKINGQFAGTKPANDVIAEIFLPPGGHGVDYNFGELTPPQQPQPQPGSLSGYVYADANQNGVKDGGEQGIAGASLSLWKLVNGQYIETGTTATTNADGYYIFNNLDPNEVYAVKETQPANYNDGQESVGSLGGDKSVNDYITAIPVGSNQHGINYNFGELIPGVPPPQQNGSISGYVYADADKNGIKGDNEAGIQNATLSLYKLVNGTYVLQRTTQTDSNGYYIFADLAPNEVYAVKETQPAGYDDGSETLGSLGGDKSVNDYITAIPVGSNQHGINYNFGELTPDVPPLQPQQNGSISGYVYLDKNQNGKKDNGDAGLQGVSVTLYKLVDGSYVPQISQKTNADGYYNFANLAPNETYAVYETQPSEYNDGSETLGSLGGDISINDYITAIPVGSNKHGVDYNFGELEKPVVIPPTPQTPSTPPAPPYTPPPNNSAVGNPGILAAPNWQPPLLSETLQAGYGGGGALATPAYSWQLSVINGGYPRDIAFAQAAGQGIYASNAPSQQVMMLNSSLTDSESSVDADAKTKYVSVNWEANPMNELVWKIRDKDGKERRLFSFGPKEGIPLAADFNGEGIAIPAVFYNGQWYIDKNGNGKWDEQEDIIVKLGTANDQPVVGDWDGDGKADVGIFGQKKEGESEIAAQETGLPSDNNALKMNAKHRKRSKNVPLFDAKKPAVRDMQVPDANAEGKFQTRRDVIDHVFESGTEGDRAFVGDFTGDGIKKIGLYRGGEWFIDKNGNGQIEDSEKLFVDTSNAESTAGGVPVVGDWDGSGIDKVGLFVNGIWYLGKGSVESGFKYEAGFRFGEAGDKPVVADFNGDGVDEFAVVRSSETDMQFTMSTPERAQIAPLVAGNAAQEDGSGNSNRQGSLPQQLQRHGRHPKFAAPQSTFNNDINRE